MGKNGQGMWFQYLVMPQVFVSVYFCHFQTIANQNEITVTLDFIFRLVLFSHENVSFNSNCLNVLEDIKQFYLLMWFKTKRLEATFKGDDVKTLINTLNCENLVVYFSERVKKMKHLLCFLVVSDQTIA